jgi:glycosyltransferase involved in cell wall biosynthesis
MPLLSIFAALKTYKIAYITETSPANKHAWSGTAHYAYEALKQYGHTVQALGPEKPGFIGFICKAINQLSLVILKKRFDYRHSTMYSKAFGRLFDAKLKKMDCDVIVVCGGTEYGAYLHTNKPIFYILDRTIEGALNYHSILSNLLEFSKRQSIATDKRAMLHSAKTIFSSEWAAQHAAKFYNLPGSKSAVLPFGANLDAVPDMETALKPKDTTIWKLLLIGTSWKHKGADIAFNALLHLLENDINAHLTVVGCTPPEELKHERLTIVPFVDKNSGNGIKELWALFLSHHFFILPTRFDCTPIVFCEASSFGLPILSSDTGGVRGHVKEGKNGFLIPFEDKGKLYAEKIMEIIRSNTYPDLCKTTRLCYEEQLNWKSWAKRFTEEVERSIS